MGYERSRFEGDVDEEFICTICLGVLQDPLQVAQCQHIFCAACLHEWLLRVSACPIDRKAVTRDQLTAAPRLCTNMLSRLQIACDYAPHGCPAFVKLEKLPEHVRECEHNPNPVQCAKGCGILVPKNNLEDHNCVLELRGIVEQQGSSIAKMQSEMQNLKASTQTEIGNLTSEIQTLKDCMRSIVESNPQMKQVQSIMEDADFTRWHRRLQTARVTRWGSMTSSPDAAMCADIWNALTDSGCPLRLANELIERSTDKNWPNGLSTLPMRQLNRGECAKYVTKRIPGKQAVVILSRDNGHMPRDLIMEPGLVMMFSNSVE
ncbi:E3 ubiquitin-protein ligase NRDP1-like [Crassostrea virginica]